MPIERGPAEELLARGVALLDDMQHNPRPVLRWYRSTDVAVVVGRGQQVIAFANTDLPVVGRFSGGGAVLMDEGLLSLDVILPAGHPLLEGDLGMPFERVGDAWAEALRQFGVPDLATHRGPATANRKGSERQRLLAAICYATLGRGEVTSAGRKIVGLSQRRRRHGALLQCGLLRRWSPAPLVEALGATVDDDVVNAAIGIDEFLDHPPTDDQIATAVEAALERIMAAP